MKKRKTVLWLSLSLLLLAGYGKDTGRVQEVNNTNENGYNENTPDNAEDGTEEEKETEVKEEDLDNTATENQEEDTGGQEERAFSDTSEELITVSVTDDTKYKVRTIKNSGEDVTEKEGEFADIKKDLMIKVTGYMDDAGEEIKASEIVIMEVL